MNRVWRFVSVCNMLRPQGEPNMKTTTIFVLLVLTAACMGFDPEKFAQDYDHHDFAKDIQARASSLQMDMREAVHKEWNIPDLQNYHAVTLLSKVKYGIQVKDATSLYGRKVLSDTACKGIEASVRKNVISTLAKYGVIEVESTTSDVPLIEVEICIRNDPQVPNAVWIETRLTVRRTLMDPASKRPIAAPVWEDRWTRVYTKPQAHLLVTEDHPDLVEKIIHDADTLVFLLAWSQYRSITTMKAAIQLDKEGILPEWFSEYVTR